MPTPKTNSTFSSSWIAKTLGVAPPAKEILYTAFSSDTRKAAATEFFVAIKGDNFDGHDFLDEATKRGVKGVLCQKGRRPATAAGVFVVEVDDVVSSFRQLAARWRAELGIPVVAIAGAVGKTTTKELLASALSGKWPEILKTEGSFNGFLGIALTLLCLRRHHQMAVIEIGIDDVGAMQQHLEVVRPDVVIVTAIAEEHLEKLIDLKTVAREELCAMDWTEAEGGHAIFNLDDPWIEKAYLKKAWKNARTVSLHGKKGTAEWTVAEIKEGALHLSSKSGNSFSLPLPLPGLHNAQNLLLAAGVSLSLGLTPEQMARGLASFQPPKGRSEVHHLPNGVLVLADYYNASPASVRASLKLFGELTHSRAGNRHFFLGDMLELGEHELALHAGLGSDVTEAHPSQVVLFGPRMKSLAQKLAGQSYRVTHFENMGELLAAQLPQIKKGDSVLIKGSRGMKMERVWEALKTKS